MRLTLIRALVLVTAACGIQYIVWRWLFSVHWAVWWIAVPLVLAETYSLIDSLLFGLTMWQLRRRPAPPPAPPDRTVDVFITTYDEPVELVMTTARAARGITYPHTTWILDDGDRAELRECAEAEGIGYVSRSSDWSDRPRHAKAGNLNNALLRTHGEFIVVLDADQIPEPNFVDATLGYMLDDRMALVQTPQFFVNVPHDDPLGSQAPLFYGPIQQGKDGWNAAFFCGSNALLRREALMQLGITRYVVEVDGAVRKALRTAGRVLDRARSDVAARDPHTAAVLRQIRQYVDDARDQVRRGEALADVTYRFQRRVEEASRALVERDLAAMRADMAALAQLSDSDDLLGLDPLVGGSVEHSGAPIIEAADAHLMSEAALRRMTQRDWSPLAAIGSVRALIESIDVDRSDEALAVMPMSTISVTEDMATCTRLHALKWRTAYHHELLAAGLAPEDLGTSLTQRLRWAQGTIQVFFRENPLFQRGLSWQQRMMYLATMWSYFSGLATVVFLAAPVLYLSAGVLPLRAISLQFFERLVPFLVANQLLFLVIGRGKKTWRGQQYSMALFPIWIKAVTTAVGNVFFGRSLAFAVTAKTRQAADKPVWRLIRPQLVAMAALLIAGVVGLLRLVLGDAQPLATTINLVWVGYDLALFSVLVPAAKYRGCVPDGAVPNRALLDGATPEGTAPDGALSEGTAADGALSEGTALPERTSFPERSVPGRTSFSERTVPDRNSASSEAILEESLT